MNRLLLPLALATFAVGAQAQLVFGSNASTSGGYYLDLQAGTAKQLWTGTSTGRVTGLTSDGTQIIGASTARFVNWQYGKVGQAPTQINGFYRLGSNGTTYATGVAGMAYVGSGANAGIYGYTNYNLTGSGPYVEDGIYRFNPAITTAGAINTTLIWRHDDLNYNFEGLAYNPADNLFYATNNPGTNATTTAGPGIFTIDAFGTGAVTKYADYDSFLTAPSGLTIGGGKIWISGKISAETAIRVASFDMTTRQYDQAFSLGGFATGAQTTALAWAPNAAVPEPASMAALGLGAFALLRRRRRA